MKTIRTLRETENWLGKPPEKKNIAKTTWNANRIQLEEQRARTVIAITFVILNYSKRQ